MTGQGKEQIWMPKEQAKRDRHRKKQSDTREGWEAVKEYTRMSKQLERIEKHRQSLRSCLSVGIKSYNFFPACTGSRGKNASALKTSMHCHLKHPHTLSLSFSPTPPRSLSLCRPQSDRSNHAYVLCRKKS